MSVPRLWTGQRRGKLAGLAAIGALQGAVALAATMAGGRLLGSGSTDEQTVSLVLTLVSATLVLITLRVVQRRFAESFALGYVTELRAAVMSHTLRVPIGAKELKPGLVMTRVVNDLSAIKLWLANGLIGLVVAGAMVTTIIGFLLWYEPGLAVALAICIGVWCLPVLAGLKPLEDAIREARKHRGRIAARAGQVLAARAAFLGYGRHNATIRSFLRLSEKMNTALVKRATLSGLLRSSSDLIFPAVVIAAGSGLALTGEQSPKASSVAMLVMMAGMLSTHLTAVALGLEYRLAHRVALGRVMTILQRPAIDLERGKRIETNGRGLQLSVKNLQIGPHRRRASFSADPGENICLAGLSAAEANDLVMKTAGLAESTGGWICLNGREAGSLRPRDWLRHVAVLSPRISLTGFHVLRDASLGSHSSVDEEERIRVVQSFGIEGTSFNGKRRSTCAICPAQTVAIRAARSILRRAGLLLVDDNELTQNSDMFDVFLSEARAIGTTVVIVNDVETPQKLGLRVIDKDDFLVQ